MSNPEREHEKHIGGRLKSLYYKTCPTLKKILICLGKDVGEDET